jgi:hypothetical protein
MERGLRIADARRGALQSGFAWARALSIGSRNTLGLGLAQKKCHTAILTSFEMQGCRLDPSCFSAALVRNKAVEFSAAYMLRLVQFYGLSTFKRPDDFEPFTRQPQFIEFICLPWNCQALPDCLSETEYYSFHAFHAKPHSRQCGDSFRGKSVLIVKPKHRTITFSCFA